MLCVILSCFKKKARSFLLSKRVNVKTERRATKKEAYNAIFVTRLLYNEIVTLFRLMLFITNYLYNKFI